MIGYILLLVLVGVLVNVLPVEPRIRTTVVIIVIVLAIMLLFGLTGPGMWDWPRWR